LMTIWRDEQSASRSSGTTGSPRAGASKTTVAAWDGGRRAASVAVAYRRLGTRTCTPPSSRES
jgi:hypothetical protein